MKARLDDRNADKSMDAFAVKETARTRGLEEIDVSLLEDSLAKTPWERMRANDDALRFADSVRAAMLDRIANSSELTQDAFGPS